MGDPLYAVGSYFVSGDRYPDRERVEDALTQVERLERVSTKAGYRRELRTIAAGLRRYLRDEEGGAR
jgi:hypothetical protein